MIVKKIILVISFIIITIGNFATSQRIEILISLDKQEFLLGEPIFLHLHVVNNSQDTVVIDEVDFQERTTIKDAKGKRYSMNIAFDRVKPFKSNFGPGDVFNRWVEITSRFGLFEDKDSRSQFFHLPIGEHSVEITNYRAYRGALEQRRTGGVFGKSFRSNQVRFSVVEPRGKEKEVFNLFKRASYFHWVKKDDEGAHRLYSELVDNYPASVYAARALKLAGVVFRFSNDLNLRDRSLLDLKRLLLEYPDSRYVINAMGSIINQHRTRNDREGLIGILEEVKTANPRTDASVIAEKWLEWARTVPEEKFDPKKVSEKVRRETEEILKKQGKKKWW